MKIFEEVVLVQSSEFMENFLKENNSKLGFRSYGIENDPKHKLVVCYSTQEELEKAEKGR